MRTAAERLAMIVNTASLAFVQATLETGEEPESEN
jgi:hypothetical protein